MPRTSTGQGNGPRSPLGKPTKSLVQCRRVLGALTRDVSSLILLTPTALMGIRVLLQDRYAQYVTVQRTWLTEFINKTVQPQFLFNGSRKAMLAFLRTVNHPIANPDAVATTVLKKITCDEVIKQARLLLETVNTVSKPDNVAMQPLSDDSSSADMLLALLEQVSTDRIRNQLQELFLLLCAHVMQSKAVYENTRRKSTRHGCTSVECIQGERFVYRLLQGTPTEIETTILQLRDTYAQTRGGIPIVYFRQANDVYHQPTSIDMSSFEFESDATKAMEGGDLDVTTLLCELGTPVRSNFLSSSSPPVTPMKSGDIPSSMCSITSPSWSSSSGSVGASFPPSYRHLEDSTSSIVSTPSPSLFSSPSSINCSPSLMILQPRNLASSLCSTRSIASSSLSNITSSSSSLDKSLGVLKIRSSARTRVATTLFTFPATQRTNHRVYSKKNKKTKKEGTLAPVTEVLSVVNLSLEHALAIVKQSRDYTVTRVEDGVVGKSPTGTIQVIDLTLDSLLATSLDIIRASTQYTVVDVSVLGVQRASTRVVTCANNHSPSLGSKRPMSSLLSSTVTNEPVLDPWMLLHEPTLTPTRWADDIVPGVDVQRYPAVISESMADRLLNWGKEQRYQGIDNLNGSSERRQMTDDLHTLSKRGCSNTDEILQLLQQIITQVFGDWWGVSCPWDVRMLRTESGSKDLPNQGHHQDYAKYEHHSFWSCILALEGKTALCICTGNKVLYLKYIALATDPFLGPCY